MKDERNQGRGDAGGGADELEGSRRPFGPEASSKRDRRRRPDVVIEGPGADLEPGDSVEFEARILTPQPRGSRVTIEWELTHRPTDGGAPLVYTRGPMEVPEHFVPWRGRKPRPGAGALEEEFESESRVPILVSEDDPLRILVDTESLPDGDWDVDATITSDYEGEESK